MFPNMEPECHRDIGLGIVKFIAEADCSVRIGERWCIIINYACHLQDGINKDTGQCRNDDAKKRKLVCSGRCYSRQKQDSGLILSSYQYLRKMLGDITAVE